MKINFNINNKIQMLISLIVFILIISACSNNNTHKNEINEVPINCPMDIKEQYTMITNIDSNIAINSRKILLESGITEDYLNKHFSFICGVEYSEDNHRVTWRYKINDIEADVIGIINAPDSVGPKFQEVVGILHDIQINITKEIAEQKIESCLNEKPEFLDIMLTSGPKDFPNMYDKPKVNHKNENGGLFMVGRTKSVQDIEDPSLFHTKTAYLNLESEKCTMSEARYYVD
jgi:hypothetical protein